MGGMDDLHDKIYDAIHRDKINLNDEATLFGWIEKQGVDKDKFVKKRMLKEAMEFIEEKMTYLGIASRKEYTIGMVVKAKLLGVNPLKGQVDFELVE